MPNQQPSDGRATLSRSVLLFRLFLSQQSDPAAFYTALASDSVEQLGNYVDLAGRTILDVGGGPGYFGRAVHEAGTRCATPSLQPVVTSPRRTPTKATEGTGFTPGSTFARVAQRLLSRLSASPAERNCGLSSLSQCPEWAYD